MNKWLEKHVWWLVAVAAGLSLLALYGNYSRWGIGAVVDSLLYAVPTILVAGILLWSLARHRASEKKE